ncbi:serine/threonine-protein kinase Aurora-2-like [Rutidosis leptorrhynchoides]|uniref:serine/threonine-protein kinase Aurora-2-like n=1 Tax=Rutidosis leptorrhynchoides TaxID=125765 RepID=UPI003A993F26
MQMLGNFQKRLRIIESVGQGVAEFVECMTCKHCVSGQKPVYHDCAVSSFSEYPVVHKGCAVKIHKDAPLEKVCLFSCGAAAGRFGAAWNVADVSKGITISIFGIGTVGAKAKAVESKEHDVSLDIRSFDILCYEFLYGLPPFEAEEHSDTYRRITQVDLKFPSKSVVSTLAKDLISQMLVKDASKPGSELHLWSLEFCL